MAQGWQFQLALEVLQQLHRVRAAKEKGLTLVQLSTLVRVDPLHLEPVLETLVTLDWVGLLNEVIEGEEARYLLLADPDNTRIEPLLHQLLLQRDATTQNLWDKGRLSLMSIRDAL
jgi:membrane protein